MWYRYLCFILLLWSTTVKAQTSLNIIAFSMDEKIDILRKLLDNPVEIKVSDGDPRFSFPKGRFSHRLLFKGNFSDEEQGNISQWQAKGFNQDFEVKIAHSFTLPRDQYLIITETLLSDAGLLGMAIVEGKTTNLKVVKEHTYVAFSKLNGKDSSEVVKIGPTQLGLLLEAGEEVKGDSWQTFTLLEIHPMSLIERWQYRTQTDNQGVCREDICFQEGVVATPSAQLHEGYFNITVRHRPSKVTDLQLIPLPGKNRLETFSFNPQKGRYIPIDAG